MNIQNVRAINLLDKFWSHSGKRQIVFLQGGSAPWNPLGVQPLDPPHPSHF